VSILVNALFLQSGPHPAPIFSVRPRPVANDPTGSIVHVMPRPRPIDQTAPLARPRADVVGDIQRELTRRGYYDGPVDGVFGPRTDAAIRDFDQAVGRKSSAEPNDDTLRAILGVPVAGKPAPAPTPQQVFRARQSDAIADVITSMRRVSAIQRALSEFGYGQVRATGTYDADTKAAIERFERERKLPITGQISGHLARELTAVTGRPLE
jgi:peptidoglycan hydrolase-like protein with peptidoglycan-binding domain